MYSSYCFRELSNFSVDAITLDDRYTKHNDSIGKARKFSYKKENFIEINHAPIFRNSIIKFFPCTEVHNHNAGVCRPFEAHIPTHTVSGV